MASALVDEGPPFLIAGRDFFDINNLTAVPAGAPYPYSGLQNFGFAVIFLLTVVSAVLTTLRVYDRWVTKHFGWDDVFMIIAQLLLPVETAATYMFMRNQYIGIHYYDIPQHDPLDSWWWNYLCQVVYYPILSLVKISVLLFILQIGGTRRWIRVAGRLCLAFEAVKSTAVFFVCIFQCWPIHYAWNPTDAMDHCIRLDVFIATSSSLNLLTDVAVLILPFCLFIFIKIGWKVRLALLSVFMMGILVIFAGSIRLYYTFSLFCNYVLDRQYSLGYITSAVECSLAIITGNLPVLWPLARRWFPGLFERLGINRKMVADIEIRTTDSRSDRHTADGGNSGRKGLFSGSNTPSGETDHTDHTARGENSSRGDGSESGIKVTTRWREQKTKPPREVYAHRSIGGSSFIIDDNTVPAYWRDLLVKAKEDEDSGSFLEMYHLMVKATIGGASSSSSTAGPSGTRGGEEGDVTTSTFFGDLGTGSRGAEDRDSITDASDRDLMATSFLNV